MAAGDITKAKQLYKINLDKMLDHAEEEFADATGEEDYDAIEACFLTAMVSALVESICEYADCYEFDRNGLLEDCILSLRKFLQQIDLETLEYAPTGMYVDPDEPQGLLS